MRSDDLFFGASGDVQPDWVDLNKVADPAGGRAAAAAGQPDHRDEPATASPCRASGTSRAASKAAVVMTGDDHGKDGTAGRFDEYAAPAARRAARSTTGSASRLDLLHLSEHAADATPQAAAYDADGFEIGAARRTPAVPTTPRPQLDNFFEHPAHELAGRTSPASAGHPPHPLHRLERLGRPAAEVEAAHGIRMDINYYYWPGSLGPGPAGLLHRLRHAHAVCPPATARSSTSTRRPPR